MTKKPGRKWADGYPPPTGAGRGEKGWRPGMQKPKVVRTMESYVAATSDADRLMWGVGAMGILLREAQVLHYPSFPDIKDWTPNMEDVLYGMAERQFELLERDVRRGKYNEEVGDAVRGISEGDEGGEAGGEGNANHSLGNGGL